MAVPKKHGTRGRTGKRRSQKTVAPVTNLRPCPQCGAPVLPHRKCQHCGYYASLRENERKRGTSG